MSYLKLRELWNECEKLDESVFNVFVEGLSEIHNKKFVSQAAKPCVAQEKRTVCNRGRWEPQEEALICGILTKKWAGQAEKPCVAEQTGNYGEAWTPEEEDLLHECCQNTNIRKGVHVFREKTGYKRTQGACELRAKELKRRGRW